MKIRTIEIINLGCVRCDQVKGLRSQIESKCLNDQVRLNQLASSQDFNHAEDLHNLNKSAICKQWLYCIDLVFFAWF